MTAVIAIIAVTVVIPVIAVTVGIPVIALTVVIPVIAVTVVIPVIAVTLLIAVIALIHVIAVLLLDRCCFGCKFSQEPKSTIENGVLMSICRVRHSAIFNCLPPRKECT